MIVVLDVSAAIEILLRKEKNGMFDATYRDATWVLAPDLYVPEISNVLWKYCRAKVITHDECIQFTDDGITMIDDFIDSRELWKEALGEGIKYNHSIYDMYYSVLARRNDATLITNDGYLASMCREQKISVCN